MLGKQHRHLLLVSYNRVCVGLYSCQYSVQLLLERTVEEWSLNYMSVVESLCPNILIAGGYPRVATVVRIVVGGAPLTESIDAEWSPRTDKAVQGILADVTSPDHLIERRVFAYPLVDLAQFAIGAVAVLIAVFASGDWYVFAPIFEHVGLGVPDHAVAVVGAFVTVVAVRLAILRFTDVDRDLTYPFVEVVECHSAASTFAIAHGSWAAVNAVVVADPLFLSGLLRTVVLLNTQRLGHGCTIVGIGTLRGCGFPLHLTINPVRQNGESDDREDEKDKDGKNSTQHEIFPVFTFHTELFLGPVLEAPFGMLRILNYGSFPKWR